MKPQSIVAVLFLVGCILINIGIGLLAGPEWVFVSAGVTLIALTTVVVRGMNRG
jgi:hypothetical protein